MVTDLDTLATALFAKTDDLIKGLPQLAPWRPRLGIAPQLSDAELVTLAMTQAMLGFTSEARWLRHARAHLREKPSEPDRSCSSLCDRSSSQSTRPSKDSSTSNGI